MVRGIVTATQTYGAALRDHMSFFGEKVLKQASTPSYRLELVWRVVPAIGTIIDLDLDPANEADQDTSCVVPKASLPEEQLIREVRDRRHRVGQRHPGQPSGGRHDAEGRPSTEEAVIADTVAKPTFFIVSAVKRGQHGSKMEDIFSAPGEDDMRRFREATPRRP